MSTFAVALIVIFDYRSSRKLVFDVVMTAERLLNVQVAVEPRLLNDLLVRLLASEQRRLSFGADGVDPDIAIVSLRHAGNVKAPVVISLPDDEANAGLGSVTHGGVAEPVLIASIEAISRLLDLHAPNWNTH